MNHTEVTLYHNPRCSKSRQTLALLEEQGINPAIVEYLKTPIDAQTIAHLLEMLDMTPRQIMRTKETVYTDNNLGDEGLDKDTLIQAIVEHPILLERPIVVQQDRAAIGRPPENVLTILK